MSSEADKRLSRRCFEEVFTPAGLDGRLLMLARTVWVAMALLAVGLFVLAIPTRFNELQHVCTAPNCNELQLFAPEVAVLKQLGLSLTFYATYNLPLEAGFTLIFVLVAVLIFWRRSDDGMALFVSLMLVTFGTTFPPVIEALARGQPAWRLPAFFIQDLALFCVVTLLYLFPDGRFVPRWTGLLALGWGLWSLMRPFFSQTTPFALGHPENFALLGLISTGVFAQLYRYTRVSRAIQRQQTKWVVFGLTTMVGGMAAYVIMHLLFSPLTQPGLGHVIGNMMSVPALLTLPGLLLPLTIGMAILRYRLWDIDSIVNRTMVYGSLTVLLVALYVGLILALQALVLAVTGSLSQQPLVIVASTLVIAALFQPFRRRLQNSIDRRFYRRKYDAAKVVVAFSATLRNEVDLNQLSERLLAVVEETMRPAQVSLWLRPPERDGTHRAPLREDEEGKEFLKNSVV